VTGREAAILFALAALQFIGLVDFMIVMPLGPQLLDDLAIDARRFSWVVSAYTLTAGLAGFLAAPGSTACRESRSISFSRSAYSWARWRAVSRPASCCCWRHGP
jgi:predicted MFS family arabinose efflux permease